MASTISYTNFFVSGISMRIAWPAYRGKEVSSLASTVFAYFYHFYIEYEN